MDEWDFDGRRASAEMLLDRLRNIVPAQARVDGIARKSKLPFKVDLLSGALGWRIHELGRAALSAYDAQMHVAGIILTRAAMESVAKLNSLHAFVMSYAGGDMDGLDDRLMRDIFGTRARDDRPKASNIMGDIDRAAKKSPAFRDLYDELSEYAHPNDSGTSYSFARLDPKGRYANFSPLGEYPGRRAWTLIEGLDTSIMFGVSLYEDLTARLPAFAHICDVDADAISVDRPSTLDP